MKKTIIHLPSVKQAASFSDKLFGLLKPKNPRFLLINTRFGIHTFFLKEPIDVAILDNQMVIRQLKEGLSPNKIFLYLPKFSKVLEMPRGTIRKQNLQKGDLIRLS